jgi:ribosomal RNA-processing protein 12
MSDQNVSRAVDGKSLNDTVATLQEVIKSQQETGKEHEPTPTEYFALISTTISVGSGGDRLPEMLKVLLAVIPNASKTIVRMQFKTMTQTLLAIIKVHSSNDMVVHSALSALGAMMLAQEASDSFWSAVHCLQAVNGLLSFVDSDSSKIRRLSHDLLISIMKAHRTAKSSSVRSYIADFCVGVILGCSRAIYKRTHFVVLFLENALAYITEDKLLPILEFSVRLQICEIPKLTAAVYRMFDTTFQSPTYSFSSASSIAALNLLLSSKPATADMESITYYCAALTSALLCVRKHDRALLLPASVEAPATGLLNKVVNGLVGLCESEFVQVHCAVGAALKRIICTVFERRTAVVTNALMQNGTAALEETQLLNIAAVLSTLFQLKYQQAWLFNLDTLRSLFDLFRFNGRPIKLLTKVVTGLVDVYQAIEHGVLQNIPGPVHVALTETIGSALRACGVKTFLEIVPLTDANSPVSASGVKLVSPSREWILTVLHQNLKSMPCALGDFGTCILPLANEYYKIIKTATNKTPAELKILRTRITQLWSLLPEFCTYNLKDLQENFSKMSPILERLFNDADYPELLTYVVGSLYQMARGARERSPRPAKGSAAASAAESAVPVSPELAVLRASACKFVPLLLQYIEGVAVGDSRFQEGVQCVAAWCDIAPAGLVSAVSKKLLQLVLTSTAASNGSGAESARESVAAAGWMAVMLAIIPLLQASLVQLLFKSIRPLLMGSDASSVQKRAYGLLLALLLEHRETVVALEPPLQMLRVVSEALLTCHVSSRSMRLSCMRSLMDGMTDQELSESLVVIFREVLICQKDSNKKSRDGAMDILKFFIRRLQPATVMQLLAAILQSPTPTDNAQQSSNILKSSAVTALCLLLLHHRNSPQMLAQAVEILPGVGELLIADCPHQTKAVLSYLRVFVTIQPVETISSEALLPNIVNAFTQSLGTHKAKFASRCRAIMRKLAHRLGEAVLRPVVPPSDQPLLDYVCKHARRARRRKDASRSEKLLASTKEERMLGSDSDSDGSGDEDEDGFDEEEDTSAPAGGAFGASSSSFSKSIGNSIAQNITMSMNASSAANQEDYRMGRRPKAQRAGDLYRSNLPSTLDDLLDDQPSLQHVMRGDTSAVGGGATGGGHKSTGGKRGRHDFDGSSSSGGGGANNKGGKVLSEDEQYDVVVTADGRVVVKEIQHEEGAASAAPQSKNRKTGPGGAPLDAGAAEEDGDIKNQQASKAHNEQKRRKLNLKDPGEEYRSKKAGGDVWKKGMLEPHAFIPLDPRLLSKKHREQAIGHFGVVVKGGKNKRTAGSVPHGSNGRGKGKGKENNKKRG